MQIMKLKQLISEAVQLIDDTSSLFYQQKNQEGYQLLNTTLNTLIQTINLICSYKSDNSEFEIDEQNLYKILENAMLALGEKDTILLSDILNFDLKIIFLELDNRL